MKVRMSNYLSIGLLIAANCIAAQSLAEQPAGKSNALQLAEYPIAVLPFQERGKEVQGMGGQASDILFAELSADPALPAELRASRDPCLRCDGRVFADLHIMRYLDEVI